MNSAFQRNVRRFTREVFQHFYRRQNRHIEEKKEKLLLNKKRLVKLKKELKEIQTFNRNSIYKNNEYTRKLRRKIRKTTRELKEFQDKLILLGEIASPKYTRDSVTIRDLKKELQCL